MLAKMALIEEEGYAVFFWSDWVVGRRRDLLHAFRIQLDAARGAFVFAGDAHYFD